jgi:hypothetical protein
LFKTCALAVTLLVASLSALLPAVARAQREMSDGTTADAWTLPNGLRIVTRHVPGADAVAIVVAYPSGRDDDPAGREGLTALMAEAAFGAAAGILPARTREQLASQRPAGWNIQVERRRTELAELATPAQFPGVVQQVALRMKEPKITDALLDQARAAIAAQQSATYDRDPGVELYVRIGQIGAGWDDAAFLRWRSGEGIAKVDAREIATRIAEAYVPARAVLSLTGDFEGVNLRAFIEREFGGIPAGTPRADVMPAPAKGGGLATVDRTDTESAYGALGLVAPALTDSLHPSFLLHTLMLGTHAGNLWGKAEGPVRSRFQYSILDDPTLARFYPPILSRTWEPGHLRTQFNAAVDHFATLSIELDQVRRMEDAVSWLLGGPLPGPLLARIQKDRAVLYRVASSAAVRELWGGEAFWSEYRRRFDPAASAGDMRWSSDMKDLGRQIGVVCQHAP